jgi:hypothetical protein
VTLGICAPPSLLRPILREIQKAPAVVVQGSRAADGGAGLAAWKRYCLAIPDFVF